MPLTINMSKINPYISLQNIEFRWFLLMRFALVFAWSAQFILIEWQVYEMTKSPIHLGYIGLAEIIPAFSMALFAGHIVDRKEKKSLLRLCIFGFSVISFGLFALTSPQIQTSFPTSKLLWGIYLMVFLGGFLRAFIAPTVFSLISLIIPREIFPNAATWNSSTFMAASIIGSSLAGFFIYWIDVHATLLIVFGITIGALLCLSQIKAKPIMNKNLDEPLGESLTKGLSFVFKNKVILGAMTLDMIAVLFGGAVALLPIFAQDILKVGPQGFGFLRAAPAVGAIISLFGTAHLPITTNTGKKLLAAIFLFGCCIIGFGLSSIYWVSLILLFFSGMTDAVSMVIRQTILQLKTPEDMKGRVSSVNSMFVGSSNELGAFESGAAAKLLGPATAVVFGGTITLLTVITTYVVSPTFRYLQLKDDQNEN